MQIAERIKTARQKLGFSQADAAKKWQLSVRTLQKWEQGDRSPRGLALRELERILERAERRANKPRKQRADQGGESDANPPTVAVIARRAKSLPGGQ